MAGVERNIHENVETGDKQCRRQVLKMMMR